MKELVPALAGTEPKTDRFEGLRASPTPGSRGALGTQRSQTRLCPGAFLLVGQTDVC